VGLFSSILNILYFVAAERFQNKNKKYNTLLMYLIYVSY